MDLDQKQSKVALGVLGVILLGAIGSGIWDVIAKPGLGWAVNSTLAIAGIFSKTVRDLPYSSAAIDASPLPSLLLLALACCILPVLYASPVIKLCVHRASTPLFRTATPAGKARAMRILMSLFIVANLLNLVLAALSFTITNKAVAIRQIWEANLGKNLLDSPNYRRYY